MFYEFVWHLTVTTETKSQRCFDRHVFSRN